MLDFLHQNGIQNVKHERQYRFYRTPLLRWVAAKFCSIYHLKPSEPLVHSPEFASRGRLFRHIEVLKQIGSSYIFS